MASLEGTQVPEQYRLLFRPPEGVKIAVCYSEWNSDITHPLRDGAIETLHEALCPNSTEDVLERQVHCFQVPGAFELIHAAASCVKTGFFDAVIVLGCVIRGETSHYDLICESVAHGIGTLNLEAFVPVIFGLVTTENKQQAKDRSGGVLGNKGREAAIAALQMIDFSCELEKNILPLHSQSN